MLLPVAVVTALVSGLAHGTGLVDHLGALTVMQVHVGSAVVALATVRWAGLDGAVAAAGPRAGSPARRCARPATGGLPVSSWLDDRPPQGDPVSWRMTVLGQPLGLADLAGMSQERIVAVRPWWTQPPFPLT